MFSHTRRSESLVEGGKYRENLEYLGYIEGRVEDAIPKFAFICEEKGYVEADMVVYRGRWTAVKLTCHNAPGGLLIEADSIKTRAEEIIKRLRRLECILRLYAHSAEAPPSILDTLIS